MSEQAVFGRRRVRSGSHITQIGNVWYYRRVVPPDVRDVFGVGKVKKSLDTSSQTEAKRLEKLHDVEFEEKLQLARHAGPDGLPRDRKARTEALVGRVYTELAGSDDPDRLEGCRRSRWSSSRPIIRRRVLANRRCRP